jgi:Fe-S-cluster-containing hydrogenase component 2
MFCPYGAIYPWPERKMALKCDRCNYMEYPVCVDVCPTRALELVELDNYDKLLQQTRKSITESVAERGREGICILDLGK